MSLEFNIGGKVSGYRMVNGVRIKVRVEWKGEMGLG